MLAPKLLHFPAPALNGEWGAPRRTLCPSRKFREVLALRFGKRARSASFLSVDNPPSLRPAVASRASPSASVSASPQAPIARLHHAAPTLAKSLTLIHPRRRTARLNWSPTFERRATNMTTAAAANRTGRKKMTRVQMEEEGTRRSVLLSQRPVVRIVASNLTLRGNSRVGVRPRLCLFLPVLPTPANRWGLRAPLYGRASRAPPTASSSRNSTSRSRLALGRSLGSRMVGSKMRRPCRRRISGRRATLRLPQVAGRL